jgi:hypothetical protein
VSDTVRALTRSVGNAGFVALGRKPIKGLDESLSLYRAVPAGTVVARPRRRRLPLAAAGTAGLAAVALLGFVLAATRLGPSPAASADPGAAASVSAEASPDPSPLPTGRYTSTRFAVPFSIDLGEGWDLRGDTADLVVFEHDEFPYGAIGIGIVAASLDPPCPTSEPVFIGERPVDLIDWLTTRDWLDAEVPRPHNIGRYVGRAVDIEIPTSDRWTCPEGRREAVHLFRLGEPPRGGEFGETLEAAVGERWRIIAVDADGRTIMVAIGSPYDDVATLWTLTEPLIQTLEFAER